MKIECLAHREGGTRTDIGGIQYHFEPLADGAHVADVTETAHIDRFLSIAEGYKVYHGTSKASAKTPAKSSAKVVEAQPEAKITPKPTGRLAGSSQHQPQYEFAGQIVTIADVVRKSLEASGLTEDEWNDLDEDERAAKIDITLDDMADAADAAEEPAAEATDERLILANAYEVKFGKKPHYRASADTIRSQLEA